MNMTSSLAKAHFGEIMEKIETEPVVITKNGRNKAVILSFSEYKHLEEMENLYWINKALKDKKSGMLDVAETKKFLDRFRK